MSRYFINHPVFAWVIAIMIVISGVLAIRGLGVESYPNIAPPQVGVFAAYPGANAETVERAVTQIIEQQLTGIDNLDYFSASSGSDGSASLNLTFKPGTDPDIAQMQVQNKVSQATPRLPGDVVQQGVTVSKSNSGFLLVIALKSSDPAIGKDELSDLLASNVLDQVARVPGVGSTQLFGGQYSMNIWLNPDKLHAYGLSASDVLSAVRAQNVQFSAGQVGGEPSPETQMFTASVAAEGRFTKPEEFENILLRANASGAAVRLRDVARVEISGSAHGFDLQWNGQPAAGFAVSLGPGENALEVAAAVKARMAQLQPSFPKGVEWFAPYDTSDFVRISVDEVIKTLGEAMVLVFLVMLLFLQNLRATLIPTLVIPVALLGTFLGMYVLGFTINQLSLFGMVLAIGIVVDDAIVVIENVERIMTEEGLSPKEATRKAMHQITGAVIAITLVLAAVFIPSALQAGSAGAVYKQFALTIAMAMLFSAFLALGFTPALCASLLKPSAHHEARNPIFRAFNKFYGKMSTIYVGHIGSAVRHAPRWMAVFAALAIGCGFLFWKMPGSFLPEEDQGYAFAIVQLPPGATLRRTNAVFEQIRAKVDKMEGFDGMMQVSGFSFIGQGENVGMAFIKLKPWDQRKITATEFIQNANGALFPIRDAQIFVANLPTVNGLGQFGGFDMYLQDRTGQGRDALMGAMGTLLGKAGENKALVGVRPNTLEPSPQLKLDVDRLQAQAMGLEVGDIYSAIQLMLAPIYVNDFVQGGRVKRVNMQADGPFRTGPESLAHYYTPSNTKDADGLPTMIPLSNVVKAKWEVASPSLTRYNGFAAVEIVGSQAPGHSSGEAMNAMQAIVEKDLPAGFGYDWAGQSHQEILSGSQTTMLMILSIIVVFLCLAALYESWSVPVAVLLVVPVGVLGAVLLSMARGLPNDIYFKIGLITVIGLAAKNAILIVEFAIQERKEGKPLGQAVVEAAKLRLRPILMTSLAFIMGVLPLAISTGAGANARHAIGTGVIGGMLAATFLGLLFIPVFYAIVRRMLGDKLDVAPKIVHEDD
ncbi:multidrug efflux RND transporter permease subunit [Lysobacter helvus]|uniref:Efflux pump membrane transporter n=2 Tax=Lysobacteraceae TaxID=32033 RepID=A0ABN6FSC0_9GAMM|nr:MULTISPECIES: multidrug efflux RND transporter permease subunit [Lysobacter]BCT92584.1 multidrug efflux RND transporter permease subunit [Lysobacter caseinilyticus]BCT95737.1 multidrug efflux RND transporter permease subunit [Lysobacter helvus]